MEIPNKKKTGIEIASTAVPWGREGEVDLCYLLDELDNEAQASFVAEVKERLSYRSLVQFAENETCQHKR